MQSANSNIDLVRFTALLGFCPNHNDIMCSQGPDVALYSTVSEMYP